MFTITPKIDQTKLADVIFALESLGANRLPNTALSVRQSTEAVQQRWVDKASNAFKKTTGRYMLGIDNGLIYPHNNDVYKGAVFNTVPHAAAIEHGIPSYDMKKALYTSSKVKISKKGKRYLIIPFRHGAPGAGGKSASTLKTMPKNIYQRAKNLPFSVQTGKIRSANLGGRSLRGVGNQGRRSQIAVRSANNLNKFVMRANPYTWKSSPYAGMIRIPRGTTGGGYYMTFRIMHEDSHGWIHPGTPPMRLAEKTANEMNHVVKAIIKDGFMNDLKMLGLAAS